eukprot:SAG31_NODE_592_length_13726_cov_7.188082_2_plen_53_part_00
MKIWVSIEWINLDQILDLVVESFQLASARMVPTKIPYDTYSRISQEYVPIGY